MSPIDLIKAKSLIDTPEKWFQGSIGKLKPGFENQRLGVRTNSENYSCLCALGAVWAVAGLNYDLDYDMERALSNSAETVYGFKTGIISFNDDSATTHEMIMKVFDHAIKQTNSH